MAERQFKNNPNYHLDSRSHRYQRNQSVVDTTGSKRDADRIAHQTEQPLLAGTPVPVRKLDHVFHVGTLDATHKGSQYKTSQEGDGLSVSLHPDEWIEIAELGGLPTWELSAPPEGGNFFDVHALSNDQRNEMHEWATEEGYVTSEERFVVSWYDSEMDSMVEMVVDTKEEAESETEENEELDGSYRSEMRLVGTDKMWERVPNADRDPAFTEDYVARIYAEDIAGCDGCWWDDDLDPDNYSAPRGVVFPAYVHSWTQGVR